MVLHEALVLARCPSLLRASFKGVTIDPKAVELFTKFIYSDEVPLCCSPVQWLGLAVCTLGEDFLRICVLILASRCI